MLSLGIIGGADGPAAVFVSGSPAAALLVLPVVIALAGAGVWLLLRRRKK